MRCQLREIWIRKETSVVYLKTLYTVTIDKPLDEAKKFTSKLVLSKK